jgi:cupin fold WbuC family metalloprotein
MDSDHGLEAKSGADALGQKTLTTTRLFDSALLNQLSAAAQAHPRLRQNHNLHTSPTDPVQRFFNAIEPGSYVVPHRHITLGKEETLIMLRGRLGLIFFDEQGLPLGTQVLAPDSHCLGAHLNLNTWHSVVALTSGTVFFEVKTGPYHPLTKTESASWAPPEGSAQVAAYLAGLQRLFPPTAS